jgi:phosphatidylglycerophosphate synthase
MSGSIFAASLRSVPLALTIFRICSAPVLVLVAGLGRERFFLVLAIAALLSDAIDGVLARRLGAASETGRLLDTWADLLIALTSFVGATLLWPETIRQEVVFISLVLAAFVIPNAVGQGLRCRAQHRRGADARRHHADHLPRGRRPRGSRGV